MYDYYYYVSYSCTHIVFISEKFSVKEHEIEPAIAERVSQRAEKKSTLLEKENCIANRNPMPSAFEIC